MWLNGRELFLLSTMLVITQDLWHVRFQTQCQPTEINTGPRNSVRRIVAFNQCQRLTGTSALMQCKQRKRKKKEEVSSHVKCTNAFSCSVCSLSIYTKILSRKQSTWGCATVQTQFMVRPVHIIQSTSPFQSPAFTITFLWSTCVASDIDTHIAQLCVL